MKLTDAYLQATSPTRKKCAWCACPIARNKPFLTVGIKDGEERHEIFVHHQSEHLCLVHYINSTNGKYVETVA